MSNGRRWMDVEHMTLFNQIYECVPCTVKMMISLPWRIEKTQ
ncbi:hypothetical protein ACPOL_0662 [Acidisarcina polymorpha]|uniref:Uncharacterized protein n=1 Tax=Acidisarcina polymorpha TaxID=2211140 RepID=A0A2Z5FT56_9BACT|nr:hypothetical protein ACPOL_0662 [Acidisarcina polymorpha]